MKQALMQATSGDMNPQDLRRRIQWDDSAEMRLRRAAIGTSLVGIASMAIVTLFQTGVIKHLPDPPLESFHSDKVNSSSVAFGYGMPDGPITLGAHAVNIALAAAGPPERHRDRPWIPLLATAIAGAQAAVAAKYLFYQMPKVDKAWCGYCITDALTHFGTFALTLPEAGKAVAALMESRLPGPQPH
ncbi:vitamin K epoxide reductase family protein [Virgifigura deserti]|uniref:vitamin K epoxide reductase family protein n=1 Tax=Virgifigura deserti TaxID=2268457 RepID=UPI003CCB7576